jgi:hypothetical protein
MGTDASVDIFSAASYNAKAIASQMLAAEIRP